MWRIGNTRLRGEPSRPKKKKKRHYTVTHRHRAGRVNGLPFDPERRRVASFSSSGHREVVKPLRLPISAWGPVRWAGSGRSEGHAADRRDMYVPIPRGSGLITTTKLGTAAVPKRAPCPPQLGCCRVVARPPSDWHVLTAGHHCRGPSPSQFYYRDNTCVPCGDLPGAASTATAPHPPFAPWV